jgi:hypothetical protein
VAIGRARNPDILERDRNVFGLPVGDVHSFIVYCAVSRRSSQRVTERLGRSLDIVQQSQLAKLKVLGKPKSEKFVRQLLRYKVEKPNLISHAYAGVGSLDLLKG